MHRTLGNLTLAALLVAWGAPTWGQAAPARRVSQRIDLDLKDRALSEAVAEIARRSGARVVADPDVEARITIRLRKVQWEQALALVAERAGCEVQRRGRAWIVTRPRDRIDIELYDANVRTALLLLARYADQSIVISPKVTGKITLRLHGVSAARAIRAVAETAGDYVVVGEGCASTRESANPETSPAERVLEGTFRGLHEPRRGRPLLLLERRDEAGSTSLDKLRLAQDPVVLALQVRLLRQLEKGSRLVVGLERGERGWSATHLVSASPRKKGAAKKGR